MGIKRTTKGFSLLELLVALAIIGILATAAVAVYSHSMKRGRDTERISDIRKAWGVILSNSFDIERYANSSEEVYEILDQYNYRLSSGLSGICYFVGISFGEGDTEADDDFVIATWGETTSTKKTGDMGVIVMGTTQGVINLSQAKIMDDPQVSLYPSDFFCNNPQGFEKVNNAFIGDSAFN